MKSVWLFVITVYAALAALGARAGSVVLGGEWRAAQDTGNVGKAEGWFGGIRAGAAKAVVPGFLSDTFRDGSDTPTWYWTEFDARAEKGTDAFLEFGLVEYLSDWWLNGQYLGRFEGRGLFSEFECTKALRDGRNLLAIRVLPAMAACRLEGLDRRDLPYFGDTKMPSGVVSSQPGIATPVKLVTRSRVRTENAVVRADPNTGRAEVSFDLVNTTPTRVELTCLITVLGPDGSVECEKSERRSLPPGSVVGEASFVLDNPPLWSERDPNLHSLSIVLLSRGLPAHRTDVTFGFREYRVKDGWFHINGRRVLHKGAHTVAGVRTCGAVYLTELARKEIWNAKSLGLDTIRLHTTPATEEMMDFCDRIGMFVILSHSAAWIDKREGTPGLKRAFERHLLAQVRRNINHPCVIAWEMQNESYCPVVREYSRDALVPLRKVDMTRLVFLDSGRWDDRLDVGSVSNPGSEKWDLGWGAEGLWCGATPDETQAHYWKDFWARSPFGKPPERGPYGDEYTVWYPQRGDVHIYQRTPLTRQGDYVLRHMGEGLKPIFVSEFGINALGGRTLAGKIEQYGFSYASNEVAEACRELRTSMETAWERRRLGDVYPSPEALNGAVYAESAKVRVAINDRLRANPNVCGLSLASSVGFGSTLSMMDFFRDIEPHLHDAIASTLAPLHWCLFVTPSHQLAGRPIEVEAVLANEDVIGPGVYPVRARIVSKELGCVWDYSTNLVIAAPAPDRYPAFALPVFKESVAGLKPGNYSCAVSMERGGMPTGGICEFTVTAGARAPAGTRVEAIGFDDSEIAWMRSHGIEVREGADRILVGRCALSDEEWGRVLDRAEKGATVVFLDVETTIRKPGPYKAINYGWYAVDRFPLLKGLIFNYIEHWAYRSWSLVKNHGLCEGLPLGVCSDALFGETAPICAFRGPPPAETAAVTLAIPHCDACGNAQGDEVHGAFDGVALGVWNYGRGKVVLNGFRILEDRLDSNPIAGRILVNLVVGGR